MFVFIIANLSSLSSSRTRRVLNAKADRVRTFAFLCDACKRRLVRTRAFFFLRRSASIARAWNRARSRSLARSLVYIQRRHDVFQANKRELRRPLFGAAAAAVCLHVDGGDGR